MHYIYICYKLQKSIIMFALNSYMYFKYVLMCTYIEYMYTCVYVYFKIRGKNNLVFTYVLPFLMLLFLSENLSFFLVLFPFSLQNFLSHFCIKFSVVTIGITIYILNFSWSILYKTTPNPGYSVTTESIIPRQAFLFWNDSKQLGWLMYSQNLEVEDKNVYGRPGRETAVFEPSPAVVRVKKGKGCLLFPVSQNSELPWPTGLSTSPKIHSWLQRYGDTG